MTAINQQAAQANSEKSNQPQVDFDMRNIKEWGSLHGAVLAGSPRLVKALIEAGADLNERNEEDLTALHMAAKFNELEIVEMLLKAGADQRLKDKHHGWTPLHFAAMVGLPECVKLLLRYPVNWD